MNYKERIAAYEADVQFPNVSGMEHLSHWWWYLDVITQLPLNSRKRTRASKLNMPAAH